MAASEIRRAIVGRIPDTLRNCVNKEYFVSSGYGESINGASGYNYNPVVPHSTTLEPLSAPGVVPTSLSTPHSTPHSTLQEAANHLTPKPESSEVHWEASITYVLFIISNFKLKFKTFSTESTNSNSKYIKIKILKSLLLIN